MSNHIDWGDLNETIYGNSYLLGKDVYIDGKHRIENINNRASLIADYLLLVTCYTHVIYH